MKLNEYADKAMVTCLPSADNMEYGMALIGSEAGELLGHWSKAIRDDNKVITPERRKLMIKELGDILWGVVLVARHLKVSLREVAQANLDKLGSRASRGKISGSGDER